MQAGDDPSLTDTWQAIVDMLYGMWQYRWVVILVAFVVSSIGWPIVTNIPDRYESKTKVVVDTQSVLGPLLKGIAVEKNYTQQFANIALRTLLTRPNLTHVVNNTSFRNDARTDQDMERLIRSLSSNIDISGVSSRKAKGNETSVYTISYTSTDAKLAYEVVQELLQLFIQNSLSESRKESDIAQEFIERQIKDYEIKLVEAEERLKEFKRKNVGLMPTQTGDYFQRHSAAADNLKTAILELKEARQKRNELQKQLEAFDALNVPASTDGGRKDLNQLDPLAARIRNLELSLDDLLLRYTERHPNVISTRESLDALRKEREQKLNDPDSKMELNLNNPVYQELKIAHGRAVAEVAALYIRVQEYENEVNDLNQLIDTIPKVEAELARLNRDYNVNRQNFESLLGRRESAKISKDVEKDTDDSLYSIVEPPKIPLVPVSPNRLMLYSAIFFGALGCGLGLAWLLTQLKPRYHSMKTLKAEFDLPVIGSVMAVQDNKEVVFQYMSSVLFFVFTVFLFGIYFLLIISQFIDLNIEKILSFILFK
ncbi:MAG: hypothetical protein OEY38_09110 [Gammaproteobacteria bacterium]|nr:hypothetical protein [Gammaproteobacteria bacterium]